MIFVKSTQHYEKMVIIPLLIQNFKRCSTVEVVHAISLKIYKHDRKALKLK